MASKKRLLRRESTTESSFLHRHINFLNLASSESNSESSEDIRGPFGLTILHEPADPLIEFVFVHGLGGGSRKTWSKTQNRAHYWPKEWLPLESQFKNVRIYSFGYNSDYGTIQGSCVTVHDFGQALLSELHNSSSAGGLENDTPIVFVAHSMGGIVAKKVLILAKQDPNYHKLASRIHSMFFLATPHRGSDSAVLLRNVLRLSGVYGSKCYVDNLIPNSEAIQIINDQFRHVYQDVQLWSFFETVKTSIGLIVEKNSSILGLPGERVQLLNADHRNVCKFDNPEDSNYRTLCNAFGSAIASIESTRFSARHEEHQSEMGKLSSFFGYSERPDADLAAISDRQVEGSCVWLTDKLSFHNWREGFEGVPRIFWLRGDPATGKSTLVGHVVKWLEESNIDCSIFFFKHNIKGKSTLAELLCSLAWQMAYSNSVIRRKLLAMQDDGIVLDRNDPSMLWRTVFLSRIFRTEFRNPHVWLIDALDESVDCALLCSFLAKIDKGIRLRLFISSRPNLTIERIFSQEKVAVTVESTSLQTSLEDIKMYLDIHAHDLPVGSSQDRQELVSEILEKSNGNFLWTTLVVKELEETVSQERIILILKSVPKGIDDLYSRIVRTTISDNKNAEVAKAILRWITCAARPLTVGELREALKLDIGETIPQLEKNAGTICGNLVYVDNMGQVHTTHQTVKDYLFRSKPKEESGFVFERAQEHGRIAEICLKFLCSDVMRTIRYRRTNMSSRETQKNVFTSYATSYFSAHLARATSSDDRHLIALNKFFLTNSLTWIELIAQKNDLGPLTETAKNLKTFLERRAKYRSPLGKEVQNVLEWADDLIRLVAQFGRALVESPSAIHFLIPSVCPSGTIIFRNFGNYPRPLKLIGLSQTKWDDRMCCVSLPQSQALSVACSDNKFFVGSNHGTVHVYQDKTFQEILSIMHGEPVRCLTVSHINGLLAAAGRSKVNLWDVASGTLVWTATVDDQPLAFEFTGDDAMLMAATRSNRMIIWDVITGKETSVFAFSDFDEDEMMPYHYLRPPIHAAFSPGLGLLGVVYRARPVSFWETETNTFAGQYHKSGDIYPEPYIHAFIFNPIPEICLAAVAFQDGDIVVFDPWSHTTHAMVHSDTSCLATSPNGTILASGSAEGVIKLFDFETLRLLYQIDSHEENIRSVAFSMNGLRFYDVRGDHCNVWEPSVLVRRVNSADDSSVDPSERLADEPHVTTARNFNDDQEMTTLAAHHEGDFIFCGFENGAIKVYCTARGKPVQNPINHANNIAILFLEWNEGNDLLASVDRTGHILVHKFQRVNGANGPFTIHKKLLGCKASSTVQQIILDVYGKRMLLSTSERVELWDLEDGRIAGEITLENPRGSGYWLTHPRDPAKLLLILGGAEVRSYQWASLNQDGKPQTLSVGQTPTADLAVSRLVVTSHGQSICVTLMGSQDHGLVPALCVYPSVEFLSDKDFIRLAASYDDLAKSIKVVIGCYKSLLIFLNHSDWVCSLNIDNLRQNKTYTRHFFIPQQWQGILVSGNVPMLVTKRGCIVIVSTDELAIFQSGLDFEEHIDIASSIQPTSLERPSLKKVISSPV